jgi:hypothetical protein
VALTVGRASEILPNQLGTLSLLPLLDLAHAFLTLPELSPYNLHAMCDLIFVFSNTHQIHTLHIHVHFIKTQSLYMFRSLLAHPQKALQEQSFGWSSLLF